MLSLRDTQCRHEIFREDDRSISETLLWRAGNEIEIDSVVLEPEQRRLKTIADGAKRDTPYLCAKWTRTWNKMAAAVPTVAEETQPSTSKEGGKKRKVVDEDETQDLDTKMYLNSFIEQAMQRIAKQVASRLQSDKT